MSREEDKRTVILGVGNELLRDEGIGVHVARRMAGMEFPFPVEIIEAGNVPDCWQAYEPVGRLVVIDAVFGGGEPGAVYRFRPEEVDWETCLSTSMHHLSFLESLKLGEIAGERPETIVLIGVEPKEVSWGMELSEEVQRCVPRVVDIVVNEIVRNR